MENIQKIKALGKRNIAMFVNRRFVENCLLEVSRNLLSLTTVVEKEMKKNLDTKKKLIKEKEGDMVFTSCPSTI